MEGFRPQRADGERTARLQDAEGFGNCSNYYECEAVCPAHVPAQFIAGLNRQYNVAAARRSAGIET